jgi:hypothetical protein
MLASTAYPTIAVRLVSRPRRILLTGYHTPLSIAPDFIGDFEITGPPHALDLPESKGPAFFTILANPIKVSHYHHWTSSFITG